MRTFLQHVLWGFLAGVAPCVRADVDRLPVTVPSENSHWKILPLNREVKAGLKLEALIVAVDGSSRVVVVSAPNPADQPETLEAFALRVRNFFSRTPATNLTEHDELSVGYQGHRQHFELAVPEGLLTCELFVFVNDRTRWALLRWGTKAAQPMTNSAFEFLQKKGLPTAGVVSLPPFKIQERAVNSFPIGLRISQNLLTGKVTKIVVTDIAPDSILDRAGIKVGDEIVGVDGRKSQDFTGGFDQQSELGKIFLNRDTGAEVELEILSAGSPKPKVVTLTNGLRPDRFHR